jgi:D-sedoheptulose 7-phosphate isomerase
MKEDTMKKWIGDYLARQAELFASLPAGDIARWIDCLQEAHRVGKRVFVCGNGGSAANASHFATDLGKGASDALGTRFQVLSLNDNTPWLTAIGNDYDYAGIFRRQLENFAQPGDLLFAASVSGSSPNLVEAFSWARDKGLETFAMVGARRGPLADIAQEVIVINDTHYGRVEDAQMAIYHLLCYAFMENPDPE